LVVAGSMEEIPSLMDLLAFFIAVESMQMATNLFNSYADFLRKIDTKKTAGDRTIVDGLLNADECYYFGCILTFMYLAIILSMTAPSPLLLQLCALGLIIAVTYSLGYAPLKYIGLGDVAVFLAFGPLLAAATVAAAGVVPASGSLSSPFPFSVTSFFEFFSHPAVVRAVSFSMPVSLLVVGILHANNIRDLKADAENGAYTLAVRIGKKAALVYFDFLLFAPFVGLAILAQVFSNPGVCLAAVALPKAFGLRKLLRGEPVQHEVVPLTAQTMVFFGVSQVVGMLLWKRFV